MTTEQGIILGFLAAAFLAGWTTRALVGAVRRPREQLPVAPEGGAGGSHDFRGASEASGSPAQRFEQAVHGSRDELARATHAYHAAVVGSLQGNGAPDRVVFESLAGSLLALSRSVDHAARELDAQDPFNRRLRRVGDDLRRLADDVTSHSRERELPAGVFDRLEQHLISTASMLLSRDRLEPRAT